jgi:hypothetical protein
MMAIFLKLFLITAILSVCFELILSDRKGKYCENCDRQILLISLFLLNKHLNILCLILLSIFLYRYI